MRMILLGLWFALVAPSQAHVMSLMIQSKDKQTTISSNQLKTLKAHSIKVRDPNESTDNKPADITFSAYDGLEILDLAYGGRKAWAKSKVLKFECADGYQPVLETKYFKDGGFYFAFARTGAKDFVIVNNLKDGMKAELGPFYLVWTKPAMQVMEKGFYWPYQIVKIIKN